MSPVSPFLAWQLVDSAFPTGAFAHSWGLEAAWQYGAIGDVTALARFAGAAVQQTATGVVPLLNAAYGAPERWDRLDERAHAFLTGAVGNRASRQQGRTLLATAARVWPSAAMSAVQRQAGTLWVHAGPAAGVVFRNIGVPLATARQLMLFGTVRGVFSAAVRLGLIGSYEAQRLQFEATPWLEAQCIRSAAFDEHDLTQTAPIADLLQSAHDRLYSRLFQS